MDELKSLINDIEAYCRVRSIAESTFGRMVVNDGKFVGRLRSGKGVTTKTVHRVRSYLDNAGTEDVAATQQSATTRERIGKTPRIEGAASMAQRGTTKKASAKKEKDGERAFRFYDNRQKYLMFINTCDEKWVVSERIGLELSQLHPTPPALRVFDAGIGDGTVLTRVMRDMHSRFPTVPFLMVGKEISMEDVRLSLEKMSDRFYEHPASVLVITNLYYAEAPWLMPSNINSAAALNWHEVALSGSTAHEFDTQIKSLLPILSDGWQVRSSEKTGNPLYVRPSVLVLYREDQRFVLDPIIPRRGKTEGTYDLVIASQPYRANMSAEFKAKKVLAPLAKSLAPGGRMIGIHSHGKDPGLEIIQSIWPGRELNQTSRHDLIKAIKAEFGPIGGRDMRFNTYSDARALFRYDMHTLPSEITSMIGTSTLFGAWNAAIYVYQIEDELIADAVEDGEYLKATQDVLQKHGGLWFINESFVISRKRN
jgi:hypothetical protein